MKPARRRTGRWLVAAIVLWSVLAYLVLPVFWRHHEHLPAMANLPKVTRAPDGLPGDPLNVALVGTEGEVQRSFAAAHWHAADPITLRSSLDIAESVVLDRPDPAAPMSALLLFRRHQDLAFEQAAGRSARQRHHVRFWRTEVTQDGRPVWVGAATFDRGVGLSHTTGQITHHIAPDVDAERDTLIRDLAAAGQLARVFDVTGIGPTLRGRNGGGDRYFTDGELTVGVLAADGAVGRDPVERVGSPAPVVVKNQFWRWLRPVLGGGGP